MPPEEREIGVRRNVHALVTEGDPGGVLEAYATAVKAMRALDEPDAGGSPTNPLSWRFQAAVHGIVDADGNQLRGDPTWNSCRHNSWFFHAWHRIYLQRFEEIVQHHLDDPGWRLPYWDYSNLDDEDARRLPAPFRDPVNELFTAEREDRVNAGEPLAPTTVDAWIALAVPDFALPLSDPRPTFGGGVVEDVMPIARARGALEGMPHGTVHGEVGGWMGAFGTAALDPIFWLHHANVDRLWAVWVELGFSSPTDETWLRTGFRLYGPSGRRTRTTIAEVVDTRAIGYEYESIEPPPRVLRELRRRKMLPEPPAEPEPGPVAVPQRVRPTPSPELVGAVSDVALDEPSTLAVDLEPPTSRLRALVAADAEPADERWYLRVENVVGRPSAAGYVVTLDPDGPGAAEPQVVGMIAAFGVREASTVTDTSDGTGVTDVFDVTEAVRGLVDAGAWNSARARVTITPMAGRVGARRAGSVRAGRISFFRG